MPPCHCPETLQMATMLFETTDLEAFEAPLLRLWIKRRWDDARGFFLLNGALLLISLGLLFLHTAYIYNPEVLIPLLLIQAWMLVVETIEIC